MKTIDEQWEEIFEQEVKIIRSVVELKPTNIEQASRAQQNLLGMIAESLVEIKRALRK